MTCVTIPPARTENDKKIYSSDFQIFITHPVKGTIIRYTLDGTEPDSINAPVYEGPLTATSSITLLKTKAYKEGWYGSEVAGAATLWR